VVVEARHEYEGQADTDDRPRPDRTSRPHSTTKPKTSRALAKRASSPKATKGSDNARTKA
jgi:hypothetical protein